MGSKITGDTLTLDVGGGTTLVVNFKSGAVKLTNAGATMSYDPVTGKISDSVGGLTIAGNRDSATDRLLTLAISNGIFTGKLTFDPKTGKPSQLDLKAQKEHVGEAEMVINSTWLDGGFTLAGTASIKLFNSSSPYLNWSWPLSVDLSTPQKFADMTGISGMVPSLKKAEDFWDGSGPPPTSTDPGPPKSGEDVPNCFFYKPCKAPTKPDLSQWINFGQDIIDQTNFPISTLAEANGLGLAGTTNDNLVAGSGNDVLVSNGGNDSLTAGTGSDTLVGASGSTTMNGHTGSTVMFVYSALVATGATPEVDTINVNNSNSTLYVGATQLVGPGGAGETFTVTSAGTQTIWTVTAGVDAGTQYQYDSKTGNLTVSHGILGADGQIVVNNFDMSAAQGLGTNTDFLNLKFKPQIDLFAGVANVGTPFNYNPSNATTNPIGSSQTITIALSAPAVAGETITLAASGSGASSDIVSLGSGNLSLASGSVTLNVPVGQDSVTVTLIDPNNSSTAETVSLTATLNNGGSTQPVSNSLAVTFNPTATATTHPTIVVNGVFSPVTGVTYYDTRVSDSTGRMHFPNTDDLITTDNGKNSIIDGSGNDSITAGSGNDTISVIDGNNTIAGGGGQDVITVGAGRNQIYAGSVVTLGTANQRLTLSKRPPSEGVSDL